MKTIIILLMIFGLYACDESTVTQPKDDTKVETQKYTLEEILADTNWVEITDTLSYSDLHLKGYSYLYENWTLYSVIKFNTLEEFKKIESKSDTNSQWYVEGALKYDIDFDKKSLIGFKTYKNVATSIYKKYFINDYLKKYQYFIISSSTLTTLANIKNYNLLIVPKIKNNYKFMADTLIIIGYK